MSAIIIDGDDPQHAIPLWTIIINLWDDSVNKFCSFSCFTFFLFVPILPFSLSNTHTPTFLGWLHKRDRSTIIKHVILVHRKRKFVSSSFTNQEINSWTKKKDFLLSINCCWFNFIVNNHFFFHYYYY